jgi:hypothetical protein
LKLKIHIGINKTGSSYLQTALALNRTGLRKKGLFVPSSQWDKQMLNGKITPGNGHSLAILLVQGSESLLLKYFQNTINEAKLNSCHTIILSNEVIIRLFSDKLILKKFYDTALKAGINSISALIFLRNPYEHALSLFKHRGKSGKFSSYEEWLLNNYETLRLFPDFLTNTREFNLINWDYKLYKRDPNWLLEKMFADFLQVYIPHQIPIGSVNPSLSLQHIQLLNWCYLEFPVIVEDLYFKIITEKNVFQDSLDLKNDFYRCCYNFFRQYEYLIKELSSLLPTEDQDGFLSVPKISTIDAIDLDSIKLSKFEFNTIINVVKDHNKNFFRNNLKITYRSIKRKFKKSSFDEKKFGGSLRGY